MPESSLLTAEIRALVGRATPSARAVVSPRAVQRAIETYTGVAGPLPAPGSVAPGYVMTALEPEPASFDFPDLLPASLLISNEWQFERPLVVGEELTLTTRLADVSERLGGRFGYSIQVRTDVEVAAAGGVIVARSVRTLLQYDPAEERQDPAP